jgi:hypothetical protein
MIVKLKLFCSIRLGNQIGTWEEEAVEIGLWYVNHLAAQPTHDQAKMDVILIGDAPPNTQELVMKGRSSYKGEDYWQRTEYFARATHVDAEARLLAEKGIPVHAFYVKDSPRQSFQEIARVTNGESGSLDIDSAEGAEKLTQLVTERILKNLGGGELVELYRKKYVKGYVAVSQARSTLFADPHQTNANATSRDAQLDGRLNLNVNHP